MLNNTTKSEKKDSVRIHHGPIIPKRTFSPPQCGGKVFREGMKSDPNRGGMLYTEVNQTGIEDDLSPETFTPSFGKP